MKKLVITGINGQLGQFIAKYLIENHPDIQVIGTTRYKSLPHTDYIFDKSRVTFELMDLSDSNSIENIIKKHQPAMFINSAANAFVGDSWTLPAQHFQINCLGVMYQLEAIRKYSPKTRYFTMGTSEEFGCTEKSLLNENSPLEPLSPYGASKCAARHIVRVWRESYGLYAIQGWTFNFESEIRGEKYVTRKITKGVARIHDAIQNNRNWQPIELGNIDSFRSWQHAEDVARGIFLMLNQDEKNYKEYVLSAPDVHNVREFVERSFAVAGVGGKWVGSGLNEQYVDEQEAVLVKINPEFYRPADVTYLHGDASAIRNELGWKSEVSFGELVKRMVESDIKNQQHARCLM